MREPIQQRVGVGAGGGLDALPVTFADRQVRLGPFQGGDEMPLAGKCPLFGRREFVIGIGGHGHGRGRASEAIADAAVVFSAADEDANRFVVVIAPQDVINKRDIEVKFPGVFGLEFAGLELDNDVAR